MKNYLRGHEEEEAEEEGGVGNIGKPGLAKLLTHTLKSTGGKDPRHIKTDTCCQVSNSKRIYLFPTVYEVGVKPQS